MIIRKYGIELRRITHGDIEMIRQARNRDDIRSKMLDQRIITPEQQERWFDSINNANNFYFVIHYQRKKIGLIHSKNIDWQAREDEGGIFIWDHTLDGTGLYTKASILLMQLCFSIAGLKRTYAQVHADNRQAYHYNLALGYRPTEANDKLVLTQEIYQSRIPKLRILASAGKDVSPLTLADISFPNYEKNQHLYAGLPEAIQQLIRSRMSGDL